MGFLIWLRDCGVCIAVVINAVSTVQAAPLAADEVQALLMQRCGDCHSGAEAEGGLDLSAFAGISKGNLRGPVVVPGQLENSILWEVIQHDKMPPENPLSQKERELIKRWIEEGATGVDPARHEHWAFQPVIRPEVPAASEMSEFTLVDRFVGWRLQELGLSYRPEADRKTLIRRVSIDLTGIPPSLDEVDTFVADDSPNAYERMVERYLNSPRYGERWGKYWLDVAGYADSNGYFNADSVRPWAYRYRDYVIASFNQDKPYDQFVREQLAGDELAGYITGEEVTPEMVELLTATQFLHNAEDGTNESDGNADELLADRFSVLAGNLQITMNGLLGMTIQCARCHSHKFEPISQYEYYQLQSIFYAAYLPEKWVKGNDRIVTTATRKEQAQHARQQALLNLQIEAIKVGLGQIRPVIRHSLIAARLPQLSSEELNAVVEADQLHTDQRNESQASLVLMHQNALQISENDLELASDLYATLRKNLAQLNADKKRELPQISIVVDVTPDPPPHYVRTHGQYSSLGAMVEPGVPAVLTVSENPFEVIPVISPQSSGRRSAFARWVTSPHHPLFGRVMVNRIWQHHFGTGLVDTPSNLGQSGALPSHPDLLDFLVDEFITGNWSIKSLHRQILYSAAYRQGSEFDANAFEQDPDNRLLWRYPVRRMDAEAIRDAMLFVSGELDLTMGGPFVPTRRVADGGVIVEESQSGKARRSVYLQQRRTQLLTFLELFDAPPILTSCGARINSTVPLQSLTLMNSEFVRLRSRAFAERLRTITQERDDGVTLGFRMAYGRAPTDEERTAVQEFLAAQEENYRNLADADLRVWTDFCQLLLASNSFLYVN